MADRESGARAVRGRFWLELALAGIAAVLFVLTLAWHDWIEAFGIEPDGGNGSLEWVVVAVSPSPRSSAARSPAPNGAGGARR